jgi:Na+/H+ antiporter NhaC
MVLTLNLASASGLGSLVRSLGGGLYVNNTATLSWVNVTGNTALVSGTAVATMALATGEGYTNHINQKFR